MIDLYYWPTPNGHKITLFLEEAALDYTIKPVNISAGDQFNPEFLAFSPNNRMPAIIDHGPVDHGEPVTVFESGAILAVEAKRELWCDGCLPDPRASSDVPEHPATDSIETRRRRKTELITGSTSGIGKAPSCPSTAAGPPNELAPLLVDPCV